MRNWTPLEWVFRTWDDKELAEVIRKARKQLLKTKIVGKGPELYYDPEDDTWKQIPKSTKPSP